MDELIPVGLTHRPELASQQAQIQATLASIQQERWRPLLPNILLAGASTNPAGTLAGGGFFPSPSGGISGMRGDIDLQVLWQLDNLGFGNRAAIHQREAENRLAEVELSRIQYQVVADILRHTPRPSRLLSGLRSAERGLRSAILSAEKNLDALQQTKGVGNQLVTLVRPQEVVAALQALAQTYSDYFRRRQRCQPCSVSPLPRLGAARPIRRARATKRETVRNWSASRHDACTNG